MVRRASVCGVTVCKGSPVSVRGRSLRGGVSRHMASQVPEC